MTGKQLINTILQEAIEGRLVPQDPNDEPASVLLDKIRKEKAKLVKEGKLKKKDLEETPISEDEKPFEIPESWAWCRLINLCKIIHYGYTASAAPTGNSKLLRITDIQDDKVNWSSVPFCSIKEKDLETYQLHNRDILIARTGGTIGKTYIVRELNDIAVFASYLIRAIPLDNIFEEYIKLFMGSPYYWSQLTDAATGTGQPNVNGQSLSKLIVPLPPLAEQKRIVAKIEELLPKVEEYGKAQEALNKLNEELPERLKKSILQEAIEGRLVPQDPNDEPASVLLDKIRKEKAKLVKEGKLKKKDLVESPVQDDEVPFNIPKTWGCFHLGEITYNHGQKKPDSDFSYIDIGSIDNKNQKLNEKENILSSNEAPSRARKIVKRGDIIYATVRPYLHNMCIIDRDFSKEPIVSTGFAVLSCIKGVYNKYLFYYLLSPVFDEYANDGDNAKGMAYPAINDKKLYNGVVPLPPLSEQHRIVAKIEQLMKEIDKLKA